MARLYQRGKIWYLDIRANGRRIRKKIGTNKKVAELALQDAVVKTERQEFGFAAKDISIDTFIDQFFEYCAAHHQPATAKRYRAVIDHFRAFLSDKRPGLKVLSQVTPEIIDQYMIHRKNAWVNPNGAGVESEDGVKAHTRKGARAHTINFEVGVLKTVFYLAIKWGYMRENPTKPIQKLKVRDAKAVRFLTKDECQRFLEACPPNLYPVYFTFLHTGMRKAELEYLEWADVDLERRKIKIRRKADWQPKTGEREIPISGQLHMVLSDLRQSRGQSAKIRYVFGDNKGGRIKAKLREKLIQIGKKAGIQDLTKVHTLRHTFASHLVMSGVDLPTVKKLMGHSDIQTTMIYAHLAPDHLAEAVDKLAFQ